MKHGKKPTRQQRQLMEDWHLDPHNWLVVKDTSEVLEIVHRLSDNTRRTIQKGV